MTRGQWLTGSLVVLGAVLGGALTAPWAARSFAPPASSVTESTKSGGEHQHTCITLTGKRFEWNFPNPPFAALSCSE